MRGENLRMKKRTIKLAVLLVAVMACLLCAAVFANATSHGFEAVANTVELDGETDGTAYVSLSVSKDTSISMIQGSWTISEVEGNEYFELVDIKSNILVFDGINNDADPTSGYIVWLDETYNGVALPKDTAVVTATYKVDADTPEGTYTVEFVTDYMADADWNEILDVFTATVTVTRPAAHTCTLTHVSAVEANCVEGGNIEYWYCADETCGKFYSDANGATEITDKTSVNTGINADNHAYPAAPTSYENNGATHTETYVCGNACGTDKVVSGVAHSYTNGACVCGEVETFTLTVDDMLGDTTTYTVPYGTNVLAYLNELVASNELSIADIEVNTEDEIGVTIFLEWCVVGGTDAVGNDAVITSDFAVWATTTSTGWAYYENGWYYQERGSLVYTNTWANIDGAWYYLDEDGYRAEGVSRVPYPTEAINGVTYAANAEDLAYYNANQGTSKYTDAASALFVFGEDGKFTATTGLVGNSYAVNGMIQWHVGLVKIADAYYYFKGDVTNGNIMVTSYDHYITRSTLGNDTPVALNSRYTFDAEGKLVIPVVDTTTGIVKEGDAYCYYVNGEKQSGNGVVELVDETGATYYIYVRSNGTLATGTYWPTMTNDLLDRGAYNWGADGKYYPEVVDTSKNGIVEEDGALCYYVNGVKQSGNGVVELEDEAGATYYIYVRSNGTLATGTYWPTTRNDLLARGAYDWGTDGKYYPAN